MPYCPAIRRVQFCVASLSLVLEHFHHPKEALVLLWYHTLTSLWHSLTSLPRCWTGPGNRVLDHVVFGYRGFQDSSMRQRPPALSPLLLPPGVVLLGVPRFYLLIDQLIDIWVISCHDCCESCCCVLVFGYMFLCGPVFSFFLGRC